jgi:ornithine carbamoyltransferase
MNLVSSEDLSKEDINKILNIADSLIENRSERALREHSTLALLFEKPSTRTRVSFETAIIQLGGAPIYIDASSSQLKRGEKISDTAKVLSGYCDFIAARMSKHSDILEMAGSSSSPVINALSDLEHPTQALTDVYTIKQHFGNLRDVKIAFMGDIATNTANSLMITAAKLGAEVALIGPAEQSPNVTYFNKAREYSKVWHYYDSIEEGLDDADIIYTDTFVSMGNEDDAEKRRKLFAPYQVNSKALSYASKKALVMHCLPAHRGEEITADVIDGDRSIVWEQAKNKLLIAKAVLLFLSERA